MYKQKLGYWIPRIFVLIFAISVFLPTPDFVSGMDYNEFIIWLIRLIWVVGLPVVFCSFILLITFLTKNTRTPG